MQNLHSVGERWTSVPVDSAGKLVDVCWLNDTDRFVLTSDGFVAKILGSHELEWSTNVNQVCSQEDIKNTWFSLTIIDAGATLVALNHHNGAIVTLDPGSGEAELVGEFDNGIHAGAWSPDAEVLLLVTLTEIGDDSDTHQSLQSVLLSMNAQFEVLEEVTIDNHLLGSDEPAPTANDNSVSIAWRPDSTLVAVSTVDAADRTRKVRIYKRESLQLHAIGRTEDGSGKLAPNLHAPLAWAGVGCSQVLASIQFKGTRTQQVAFFESNGLRHREFVLRDVTESTTVRSLTWNYNSDLLAVSMRSGNNDKVQLWHRSNYHWYLKKELLFENQAIVNVKFSSSDRPYTLAICVESSPSLVEYDLRWDPATIGYTSTTATAYVIDGQSLNITPLHKAIIPPPMYDSALKLGFSISHMTPSRNECSRFLGFAVLCNGTLAIIGPKDDIGTRSGFISPMLLATSEPSAEFQSLRHCCIVAEEGNAISFIGAVSARDADDGDLILQAQISLVEGAEAQVTITSRMKVEGRVLAITPWLDTHEGALVELEDGHLFEFVRHDDSFGALIPSMVEPLLEPCPWISGLKSISKYCDDQHKDNKSLVVGLSSKLRLYCHDTMLSDAASSFCLSTRHRYLCFSSTGSQCQMRFLALEELCNFDPLSGSDENAFLQGFETRNIERGAKIVAVIPTRPTAILQMPRGNLEGVYPRALVLRYIIGCINQNDFKNAFAMMRTQKVDLNLIVDLNPFDFVRGPGARIFLSQVDNIDHLNLFISTLANYDSTKSRLVIPDWLRKSEEGSIQEAFDFDSKVTECCRRLRAIMIEAEQHGQTIEGETIRRGYYLLPILSTFAKEEPPKLSEALKLVCDMAEASPTTSRAKSPLFGDLAQAAIQYLAFLADYKLLFDTALSMYDFDLARAVARNSQMDPKVYLPLLKRYRELPTHYAMFEVDMRLQRFEQALRHLCHSRKADESLERAMVDELSDTPPVGNDFQSCLTIIEENHLHSLGLKLFDHTEEQSRILTSLGDYLLEQKNSSVALSVFLSIVPMDVERCKIASRLCRDWRTYFYLLSSQSAAHDDLDSERRKAAAFEISDDLVSDAVGHPNRRGLLADAAMVSMQYGEDVNRAVDLYIQGENWSEAQRIACLENRPDLFRRCTEAAVSFAHTAAIELEERGANFRSTMSRYAEVLKIRKESMADDHMAFETLEADETGSLFSATSQASNLSMTSTTSSGSIGSISSVISVKSTNTFSVVGSEEATRHKSKYNERGAKKRDRGTKKKRGRSARVQPGSEQELEGLVQTLRTSCVDELYRDVIEETITYLFRQREMDVAQVLYNAYMALVSVVGEAQQQRQTKQELPRTANDQPFVCEPRVHPLEQEVDIMEIPDLSASLHQLLSLIPISSSDL